jgi:hypothetical protein
MPSPFARPPARPAAGRDARRPQNPQAYKALQLLWFALVIGVACFPGIFGFSGFKDLLSSSPL